MKSTPPLYLEGRQPKLLSAFFPCLKPRSGQNVHFLLNMTVTRDWGATSS